MASPRVLEGGLVPDGHAALAAREAEVENRLRALEERGRELEVRVRALAARRAELEQGMEGQRQLAERLQQRRLALDERETELGDIERLKREQAEAAELLQNRRDGLDRAARALAEQAGRLLSARREVEAREAQAALRAEELRTPEEVVAERLPELGER